MMTRFASRTLASTLALALGLGLALPVAAQTAEPQAGFPEATQQPPLPDAVTVPPVGEAMAPDAADAPDMDATNMDAPDDAAAAGDEPPVDAVPDSAAVDTAPSMAVVPPAEATTAPMQTGTAASAEEIRSSLPAAIAALAANEAVGKAGDLKRRADAVVRFYSARADAPAWIDHNGFTEKGKAIIARLIEVADDGLDPADYALPDPDFRPMSSDMAATAAQDVGLSLAVATFAEQASGGRLVPTSIYKDITRTPERANAVKALASVQSSANPAATLDGFNPPEQAFARLRAKLAELRAAGKHSATTEPVALAKTLKPGMSDPGVPALRKRLGQPAVADAEAAQFYDDALVGAVEAFQTQAGINADGVIGSRTLGVLNQGSGNLADEIAANMEIWRWMPRDLSRDYVFVNVPEFKVRVFRDGKQVHEARVVVGRTTNQTPIFSGEMQYLVVNPYWNVPESIKIKEMLPEIKADPAGYFNRHGYEATWNGQVIDPSRIIWDENAVKAVGIRQVPGEANALGHIKFMFPNQHAVYLHDTPLRKLFGRDVRAFSHGCVRVDDPMTFAAAVLDGDPVWNVPKLQSMFGGPEQRVDIATHLKVHIAYFTTVVGDNGQVQVFNDIYGHVQRIEAAFRRSKI